MKTGPSRPDGGEHGTSAPRSSADTPVIRRDTLAGASTFSGVRSRPHPAPTRQMPFAATSPPGELNRPKALAAKAVVMIDPPNRAGEIVWPVG